MLTTLDTRKMVDEIALSLQQSFDKQTETEEGDLMDLMDKYTQVEEPVGIAIDFPRELLGEDEAERLRNLLSSKGPLIKKALGVETLDFEVKEERINFPWFNREIEQEELLVYVRFIRKLIQRAKDASIIHPEFKQPTNEKYAFRCFLLRLDYIGDEYKVDRKILLKNFTGSSAFRNEVGENGFAN
jgi:hypothetical protein